MNINHHNYEEWMIAYLDGELNADEQKVFQDFMDKNPSLQEELAAYKALQFSGEEEVVFENKEVLYKKTSSVAWLKKTWPMAAAILLLLAAIPFLQQNNSEHRKTEKLVQEPIQLKDTLPSKIETVIAAEKDETSSTTNPIQPRSGLYTAPVVAQERFKKQPTQTNTVEKKITKKIETLKEPELDIETKLPKQDYVKEEAKDQTPAPLIEEPKEKEAVAMEEKRILQHIPIKNKAIENTLQENGTTFLVISEEKTPVLHHKLSEVMSSIEDKIEKIKTIKETPLTVCLGKRKLFTINN